MFDTILIFELLDSFVCKNHNSLASTSASTPARLAKSTDEKSTSPPARPQAFLSLFGNYRAPKLLIFGCVDSFLLLSWATETGWARLAAV